MMGVFQEEEKIMTTVENCSDMVSMLLNALHIDSTDPTAWLALADALEETGQRDRAELVRLTRTLTDHREATEYRVQELLASGIQPCVPLLTNSVGMKFALIPAGTFVMGSPESETDYADYKGPQHEVEITRPFYMGIYQVTQEQYERVMGVNPSHFKSVDGENTRLFPVENVSWEEAVEFCKKLTALAAEKRSGRKYRLPSEAEWEYSCRGGASSYQVFHFGDTLSSKQANFDGNYPYGKAKKGPYLKRTCKFGSFMPNAFGLYDMHGNVWEWCADCYAEDYFGKSPRVDPAGLSEGSDRVIRGGCWYNYASYCRSAIRFHFAPSRRNYYVGCRVIVESKHLKVI